MYIKMVNKYYQKEVCERYKNLSQEEKQKKPQYYHDQNKNLSEEGKPKRTRNLWIRTRN